MFRNLVRLFSAALFIVLIYGAICTQTPTFALQKAAVKPSGRAMG